MAHIGRSHSAHDRFFGFGLARYTFLMQPWRHADLTARAMGEEWSSHLAVHEFMDLTKTSCPDLRHRLVLHNCDLGPELATRAFPQFTSARSIALEHVRQDIGGSPSLSDWLDSYDDARLPPLLSPDWSELIAAATRHQGLKDAAPVRQVLEILMLPTTFAPDHGQRALRVLMNGFGPALVRAIMGPAYRLCAGGGDQAVFDPSWTAEGFVVAQCGRIPSLSESLVGLK